MHCLYPKLHNFPAAYIRYVCDFLITGGYIYRLVEIRLSVVLGVEDWPKKNNEKFIFFLHGKLSWHGNERRYCDRWQKRWVNLQVLYLYFGGAIVIFNSNLYDCKLTESKIILFNCRWKITYTKDITGYLFNHLDITH